MNNSPTTHGALTEPSLIDHVGKGREGKWNRRGKVVLHGFVTTGGVKTRFKFCGGCRTHKLDEHFFRSSRNYDGLQSRCKSCTRARRAQKPDPPIGPENRRRDNLSRLHGIRVEQYDAMLANQSGVCAICGSPETSVGPSGKTRRLAVDHCHATGVIRGLLCNRCNVGLGYFLDDPVRLVAAIGYLNTPRTTPHAPRRPATRAPMQQSLVGGGWA